MSTNYYTSDLHLGHANIIKLCNRPFSNIEEMDEALISNWNARVHRDDHVYIIGDLAFRNVQPIVNYLDRLKGKKHLIVGNHDAKWMKQVRMSDYFESVDTLLEAIDKNRKTVMCHYPMMSWPGKGSYLIHGHVHGNKHMNYWPLLKTYDLALNASVEINDYQPVTLEELIKNNDTWKSDDI